ncbi:MAG: hypothetical protein V3U36_03630 [Anaerolineales bacterium]
MSEIIIVGVGGGGEVAVGAGVVAGGSGVLVGGSGVLVGGSGVLVGGGGWHRDWSSRSLPRRSRPTCP